jgi:N-methylhydantoinase A
MRVAVADLTSTLDRRLGRPLGLGAKTTAVGIQDVLTESMAAATRTHLAEKGGDPTAYTLMAFGGAGPVHAYALAKRLKIRRIIIPPGAGVASAFGFLVAAPAVDAATSCPAPLDRVDWERVTRLLDAMEANARVLVAAAAGDDVELSFRRSADMRYVGQGHEIEVELPAGALGSDRAGEIGEAFADTYRATFGRTIENATPELVSVRSLASAPRFDITLPGHSEQAGQRPESRRPVYFLGFGELATVVYDRGALEPGTVLRGPVVIQERHTSCSLGPDCLISVDERQNLIVDIQPSAKAKPSPTRPR